MRIRNLLNWLLASLGFGLRPVKQRAFRPVTRENIEKRIAMKPREGDNGVSTSLRYGQVERRRKLRKKRAKGLA